MRGRIGHVGVALDAGLPAQRVKAEALLQQPRLAHLRSTPRAPPSLASLATPGLIAHRALCRGAACSPGGDQAGVGTHAE